MVQIMDNNSPEARLEATTAMSTTTTSTGNTIGLKRQPTKYPHGLNITVQTIGNNTDNDSNTNTNSNTNTAIDYSRASTLRSDSWSDTQKYTIGMMGSDETLAELQVRRYKYPLTANYYLNGKGDNNHGGVGAVMAPKSTIPPLLLLVEHAKRACRWKYMRWLIIFVASVLLFFGLITYCLWLHDVSVVRARYLQRRLDATTATIATTTTTQQQTTISTDQELNEHDDGNDDDDEIYTTTTKSTTTTTQESTRLKAVMMMMHEKEQQQQLQQEEMSNLEPRTDGTFEIPGDDDYDDVLLPADSIRFTSGHQNSFGVPIEQDARMLQLLKQLLPIQKTTPPSNVRVLTRVSPTLPPPAVVAGGRPTSAMTTTISSLLLDTNNSGSSAGGGGGGSCYSTTLPMCRGVLDYDLTSGASGAANNDEAMAAYEQLVNANCSARAVEFVCAVLEPECRPLHIGQLPPCRRICKAILEACSIVIANSDALTELFDCNLYPDAHEAHKCEDPTRRRDHCYDNEFECSDGSCIPQQWQCDNLKDCGGGEDEQECLVCDQQDEFRCRSNEKCVPEEQRCDSNFDCFDGSDEEDCDDYGSGEAAVFDEVEMNTFPRVFSYASFLSPNETNEKLYTYITATTDEETGTETKYQVHRVEAPAELNNRNNSSSSSASSEEASSTSSVDQSTKGFVNFRDSKEIMMTSDSETKFKYSAQRANRTSSKFSISSTPLRPAGSLQMQQQQQQQQSHRTVTSSGGGGVESETVTAAPRRSPNIGNCPPHQLRCVSGLCINVSQLCDKHIDCPDGADELMCVYRDRLTSRRGNASAATTTTVSTATVATVAAASTTTTAPPTTITNANTTKRTVRTTINRSVSRKPNS